MNEYQSEYLRRKKNDQSRAAAVAKQTEQRKFHKQMRYLGIATAITGAVLMAVVPMRFQAIAGGDTSAEQQYLLDNANRGVLSADNAIDAQVATSDTGDVIEFADSLTIANSTTLASADQPVTVALSIISQGTAEATGISDFANLEAAGNDIDVRSDSRQMELYDPGENSLYFMGLLDKARATGSTAIVDVQFSYEGIPVTSENGIIYDTDTSIVYVPKKNGNQPALEAKALIIVDEATFTSYAVTSEQATAEEAAIDPLVLGVQGASEDVSNDVPNDIPDNASESAPENAEDVNHIDNPNEYAEHPTLPIEEGTEVIIADDPNDVATAEGLDELAAQESVASSNDIIEVPDPSDGNSPELGLIELDKQPQPLNVTTSAQQLSISSLQSASVTVTPLVVNGAKGMITYTKLSGPDCLSINQNDGKVTVRKGTGAGTYAIQIKVYAAGDSTYNSAEKIVTATITVTPKKSQTVTATTTTRSTTYNSTKEWSVAFDKVISCSGHGTISFSKIGGSGYISVNSNKKQFILTRGTPVGTYTATIRVTAAGDADYNAASTDITVTLAVTKANQSMSVKASKQVGTYSTSAQTFRPLTVTGTQGAVTYSGKYVNPNTGAIKLPASFSAGTHKIQVTVKAAGNSNYNGASKTLTVTIKLNKAAQPMNVQTRSQSGTYSTSAQTFYPITVTKARGKVTYSGTYVNSNTGAIKLPASFSAGSHTIKVTVQAAGNSNYKAGSKTVIARIKLSKAEQHMQVRATTKNVTCSEYGQTVSNPLTVTGAKGKVTYSGVDVSTTTGNIWLPSYCGAGFRQVRVTVKAAGNSNYNAASKTVTATIRISKAKQYPSVRDWTTRFWLSSLPQRKRLDISVYDAHGRITYSKSYAPYKLNCSVDSSGYVTVHKGTPKGRYRLGVNIKVAGNNKYNSTTKFVYVTIDVS